MIYKDGKKVIPYKDDYQPVKIYKDGKLISSAEKVSDEGTSLTIESEYKTPCVKKVSGYTEKVFDGNNNVYGVEGGAYKYNQIFNNSSLQSYSSYPFTISGVTFSLVNGMVILNGTSTANIGVVSYAKITKGHKYFRRNVKSNGLGIYSTYEIDNESILNANNNDTYLSISILAGRTFNNTPYLGCCADLTDMFGAGNEPTTLDQFYATPQGKLYRGYVEYGYHILGAGEYKSNQHCTNANFENGALYWTVYDSSYAKLSIVNKKARLTLLQKFETSYWVQSLQKNITLIKGNKYLVVAKADNIYPNYYEIGGANPSETKKYGSDIVAFKGTVPSTSSYRNRILLAPRLVNVGDYQDFEYMVIHNLTELGLDHLTLDELKAQRPDLFVYQPYHETETRCGMIFNDGSVYPHEPLYGIGDVKDRQSTNGVRNGKFGVVDLGTLNWQTGWGGYYTSDLRNVIAIPSGSNAGNFISSIYKPSMEISEDLTAFIHDSAQYIGYFVCQNKSITSIPEFKQAMQGVMLVYELATPTTTLTEPAILPDLEVVNEPYDKEVVPMHHIEWCDKMDLNGETIEGLDLHKLGEEQDVVIVNGKGKNLFRYDWEQGTISIDNGTEQSSPIRVRTGYIPVETFVNYVASFKSGSLFIRNGVAYDENKNFIGGGYYPDVNRNTLTITNPRVKYIRLIYSKTNTNDAIDVNYAKSCDLQLEIGLTPTSYEPYLPNKVWKHKSFFGCKIKDLYFSKLSELGGLYRYESSVTTNVVKLDGKIICNGLKTIKYLYVEDESISTRTNINYIRILTSKYGTLEEMLNAYGEYDIVYELATPQWEDITETELGQSLLNAKTTPNTEMRISVNKGVVEAEWYEAK